MPMKTDGDGDLLKIPLKNGELAFTVKFVQFNGSSKPFIVRKLELGSAKQKTVTEQHTLIQSTAELLNWIARDEFSSLHPESFEKLRKICWTAFP